MYVIKRANREYVAKYGAHSYTKTFNEWFAGQEDDIQMFTLDEFLDEVTKE